MSATEGSFYGQPMLKLIRKWKAIVPGAALPQRIRIFLSLCAMASGWHEAELNGRPVMSIARNVQWRAWGNGVSPARRAQVPGLKSTTWIASGNQSYHARWLERLMRIIEGSHCITGQESAVELALREALNNAVVHGNRLDARKLVSRSAARCRVGKGISITVSAHGQGFDASSVSRSRGCRESVGGNTDAAIHVMKVDDGRGFVRAAGCQSSHVERVRQNHTKAKLNPSNESAQRYAKKQPSAPMQANGVTSSTG